MRHKLFNCITRNGTQFERVSNWINREEFYDVDEKHPLYDYRMDENGYNSYSDKFDDSNGTYVDGYKYKGKYYAVEQFHLLTNPFYYQGYPEELHAVSDNEIVYLHCFDVDGCLYYPLYGEISPDGEQIRFYKQVKRGYLD